MPVVLSDTDTDTVTVSVSVSVTVRLYSVTMINWKQSVREGLPNRGNIPLYCYRERNAKNESRYRVSRLRVKTHTTHILGGGGERD
jgi:hypothetical protein